MDLQQVQSVLVLILSNTINNNDCDIIGII